MSDDVWKRNEIDSPCVKVCVLHPGAKICIGCLRTGNEIARWSRYSADERKSIMEDLPSRAGLLKGKRQGRAARR